MEQIHYKIAINFQSVAQIVQIYIIWSGPRTRPVQII
uniref:Uncharacterized protein n=1 Tax=Anguilla anguilla TaxID=7936 RepID=A0A0E9VJQ0_ANGAN